MTNLLAPGHTACAGCGQAVGARMVLNAAGQDVIVANATGCLEVFTTRLPQSAWEVPWLHSVFGNAAAVGSGIEAALRRLGRTGTKVLVFGGDGGTADIGLGALSGMLERGHDLLYVCFDNGAYMNTGVQRSGLTPLYARTMTSPPGRVSRGNRTQAKDLPAIALAHRAAYVATASIAYPRDVEAKVKQALTLTGPKYLQLFVPCPLGWGSAPADTVKIARLAVETWLYPLFAVENGIITSVPKVNKPKPVEEYLKLQGRFRHLFTEPEGPEQIAELQALADDNRRRWEQVTKGTGVRIPA